MLSFFFFLSLIFYGGPISSTWDFSKKMGERIEIYVSTTNTNGKEKLSNVSTKKHIKQAENVFIRYYNDEIINFFFLFLSCMECFLT